MQLRKKRIFVGNLPPRLSKTDIEKKLRKFGNVLSVELKQRTDNEGNVLSSFAFVDIETDSDKLESCFRRFETELWCDRKVKLELAKESFLDRLKREQISAKSQTLLSKSTNVNNSSSYEVKQSDSMNRIDDYVGNNCSIPPSYNSRSSLSKGTESGFDRIEESSKKTKRNTEKSSMHRLLPEVKSNDKSFKQRTEMEILSERQSDTEIFKRNGSLPMFCGTKNLMDLDDNCINKSLLSQEKSVLHRLPSSNKSSLNYRSSSSEKEVAEDKNESIVSSSTVEPHHLPKKITVHSVERKRKKPEHDRMAEKKRLNAIEERKKALSLQKQAVKMALSSVDLKTTSNKKIVFDQDEDDEEPIDLPKEKNYYHNANDKAPKHKLFEDSSDDEALETLEVEEFKIKPQFEGPQGRKLLEIQSRYGNDSRFALDERFLESDDEVEPGEKERETEDFDAEKQHQLHILQELLGVDVSTKPTKKDRKDNRNHMEMVRFDPTNPEHSKYIVKGEDKDAKKAAEKDGEVKKKKKKREEEERKEEEKPIPTSTERFYVVSDLLRESLKKNNEQSDTTKARDGSEQRENAKGFSLLKAFGSAPSDNEEDEGKQPYIELAIKKGLSGLEENPFKYDSSDYEEEDTENCDNPEKASLENTAEMSAAKQDNAPTDFAERFYFRDGDARLQEGLEFFRVKKTFDEMQEGFQEKRADLKSIIKAKVRNNKKRKLPYRKKLGGPKRFKRNVFYKARH